MLRFVAETAGAAGLDDYKVLVNVGAGRRADGLPPPLARPRRSLRHGALATRARGGDRMSLIARIETELKEARLARDEDRRDALSLVLSSLQSRAEGASAPALRRRGASGPPA